MAMLKVNLDFTGSIEFACKHRDLDKTILRKEKAVRKNL